MSWIGNSIKDFLKKPENLDEVKNICIDFYNNLDTENKKKINKFLDEELLKLNTTKYLLNEIYKLKNNEVK
jgi:YesN/AraC family two-component response regulator